MKFETDVINENITAQLYPDGYMEVALGDLVLGSDTKVLNEEHMRKRLWYDWGMASRSFNIVACDMPDVHYLVAGAKMRCGAPKGRYTGDPTIVTCKECNS